MQQSPLSPFLGYHNCKLSQASAAFSLRVCLKFQLLSSILNDGSHPAPTEIKGRTSTDFTGCWKWPKRVFGNHSHEEAFM